MTSATVAARPVRPLTADGYEKALAAGAILLFGVVLVALARGRSHWGEVPGIVWAHLATIAVALVLTPVMLLRRRGDAPHRALGKLWVAAMFLTAVLTFWVRESHPGHFSVIHIISLYVVVAAPMVWWTAATGRIESHRRYVRGMVTGAVLIAGFFTLPFGRMLGTWLFA